jgi:hypothetical protein
MRTVFAATQAGLVVTNNVRTCAERRLLERLVHVARVRGVTAHRVILFVRRTVGRLTIRRTTADGSVACSLPCIYCRRQLEAFHLRWSAHSHDGPVDERTAGPSSLTHRQRNDWKGGGTPFNPRGRRRGLFS